MKQQTGNSIRWMIMVDDLVMEDWAIRYIQTILKETAQELVGIIVNDSKLVKNTGLSKFKTYPYRHFLFRLYQRFYIKKDIQRFHIIEQLQLKQTSIFACNPIKKGANHSFSEDDLSKIKAQQAHVILRFGFGILKGDILNIAPYGIWSFHHDDEQVIRGGPAGFWEIYHHHSQNGILLQQLNERLDAGNQIEKSFIPVCHHSYKAHVETLVNEGNVLLQKAFRQLILQPDSYLNLNKVETKAPLYKFPTNAQFVYFLFKLMCNKISFHWNELMKTEFWQVISFEHFITSHINLSDLLGLTNVQFYKATSKHYVADPFIYTCQSKQYILAEEYDYTTHKAHIVQWEMNDMRTKQIAIKEDFHLSYPYIFQMSNETYCIPESYQANCIRLYQLNTQTNSFYFKHNLIEHIPAVDSSLFYYDNRYWLFCSQQQACTNAYLYLYFSNSLNESFEPHPQNPIVCDIRYARSAGTIEIVNNEIIRPAQDCSKTYGWKIHRMRIVELSTSCYRESYVSTIDANAKSKYRGIHTLSTLQKTSVADVKYYQFSWINFIYQLKRKLRLISN